MTYEGIHQYYDASTCTYHGQFAVYADAYDMWYWSDRDDGGAHGPWPHAYQAYDDAMLQGEL